MSKILYDGLLKDAQSPQLSHKESGFAYGLGVFDTALIIDGEMQHAKLHFDRLVHDAKMVLGQSPYTQLEAYLADIRTLLAAQNMLEGRVRVRTSIFGGQVTKPLAPITDIHTLTDAGYAPDPSELPPIHAILTDAFPKIAGSALENCKRLDYTGAYLARRLAESHDCNEALLTNTLGHVVCATTSNLFLEDDTGKWITPPLSEGILDGTMRRAVMEELTVFEAPLSVADVINAPALYLSNSISGVRKIASLKNLIRQKA
ncbi:MAG: aminotransferase class IV [Pseudobdellovibrionaceae bacterium]